MDKDKIKKELTQKSNDILDNYNEPYVVETVSVMNMASKIVFLGSLKVFNESNVGEIINDLNNHLGDYGKLSIRDEKIISCCSPNYTHISFNISINS